MSSTVIPREKLSAYQRWELNSFDAGAAAEPQAETAQADARSQREGYEAGYRVGVAAAHADVQRAAAAQAAQLNALLAAASHEIATIDAHLADELLDLALALARRLAGEALRLRPELVLPVVRECLQASGRAHAPAQIALHPADALIVREHLGEQCAAGGWIISEDPSLVRGGCRLESAGGSLDASIESRWQRLLAAFGRDGEWLDPPANPS
jgi:flagellar assembly protein FliH